MFTGEATRYAAFDGELSDLDTNPSPNFAPWISASWGSKFRWRGVGAMPEAELQQLRSIVSRAHEQGRRVRFWGAPDNPNFWQAMLVAGVDLINTDDLAGLEKFLNEGSGGSSQRPTPGPSEEGNNRSAPRTFQLSRAEYLDRVRAIWTAQIAAVLMGFQFEHKVASAVWVDGYPKRYEAAPVDDDWYYEMVAIHGFEK